MEFNNEIFFNKPLKAGTTVIITYSGKLYREHSKDITIVYGYGDNWEYTDSSPMIEKDNGFEVTITLKNYNKFNFCFSNSFNIWDNNFGLNYIAPISQNEDNINSENTDSSSSNGNWNNDNSKNTASSSSDGNWNNDSSENTDSSSDENWNNDNSNNTEQDKVSKITNDNIERQEIEKYFSNFIDSLLNDIEDINETDTTSNLSEYGLESVDTVIESDIVNCDDIFAQLFNELTIDTTKSENVSTIEAIKNTNDSENKDSNYSSCEIKELDHLMDNLLESISEEKNTIEYATPLPEIQVNNSENINLPAVRLENEDDWLDKFINMSYNFSRKVTIVFKKIKKLIKDKAKEYGLINDNKN